MDEWMDGWLDWTQKVHSQSKPPKVESIDQTIGGYNFDGLMELGKGEGKRIAMDVGSQTQQTDVVRDLEIG